MSGSAARRYMMVEETEDFLGTRKASEILANLSAGAFGEVGDEHGPDFYEDIREPEYLDDDPEVRAKSDMNAVTQEMIDRQHARLQMSGGRHALLEPGATADIVPFPGMEMGADAIPFGENVALDMDEGLRTRLGSLVKQTYGIDNASREEWLKGYEKALELVDYQTKVKTYPIERASNIKYPLLIMASLQFAARAYPSIVKPGNMVRMKVEGLEPTAPDPEQIAPDKLNTPEGQRQFKLAMIKSQKTERGMRVGKYMSWQLRSHIKEWEEETDQLLHRLPLVGCEFRKMYRCAATGRKRAVLVSSKDVVLPFKARSVEQSPRISQRFDLYPYELQSKILSGEYLDIRKELALDNENAEDNQQPIEFIEQHMRFDLDKDGYDEPLIITVHKDTGTVARIELNYDEQDIKRNRKGRITAIIPTQIFVKYDFLPNPLGGIYGVGFGHILRDITDAINTTLNQIFDAAHLQNAAGGFLAKGLRFGRGEQGDKLHIAQNRYHYVNSTGADLRTQIVPFDHKGPSPVLFQVLGLLIEAGKEISSIKDILTGDQGQSSNLPVGTTLALIEQGLQVFSAIYKRVYRAMSREFGVLFELNSKTLNEEEYMIVTDDPRATPDDFAQGDHDLTPVADPNAVTDMQKLGRSQFLQQFLSDPMLNRREIYKRIFEGANIEDQEALFAPPDMVADQLAMIQLQTAHAEMLDVQAGVGLKKAQTVETMAKASKLGVDASVSGEGIRQKDRELDIREEEAEAKKEAAKRAAAKPKPTD